MFQTVITTLAALTALLAPIETMTIEETVARMAELSMQIVMGGGEPTPAQDDEMQALERRLDQLTAQLDEEVNTLDAEAERQGQALRAAGPPDQTPIDTIGRAFQKAMPETWEGETCNDDVKDTYLNLTPWFQSQGMPDRGQQFERTCGDLRGQWFTWTLATLELGEVNPDGFRPELVQPENRKLLEFTTLCGHDAVITAMFNIVEVNIDGKANLLTNASYDDKQPAGAILAMQRRMADAVDCDLISGALPNP